MTSIETAERYFHLAADVMDLSSNMRRLMLTPLRQVKVQIAMHRDNGEIGTYIGYRIQHDSARGPMKGGRGQAAVMVTRPERWSRRGDMKFPAPGVGSVPIVSM